MKRDADFAGFLSETFAVARDALPWMAGFVAVLTLLNAIPGLIFGIVDSEYSLTWGFRIDANVFAAGGLAVLTTIVLGIVSFLAQYLFFAHLLAHRGYAIGHNRFLGYFGLQLLMGLGVAFGLILLIVPGIILLVRWGLAGGFVAGTDTPVMDAFGKSWDATRGYGWPLFFSMVVLGLATSVAIGVIVFPIVAILGEGSTMSIIAQSLGQTISSAMFLAYGAGAFYLLNDDSQAVSEVFE